MSQRVVIDTKVYVSRCIRPSSVPGMAVLKAWEHQETLLSTATWTELCIVLRRPKLARFVDPELLATFLSYVLSVAESVRITSPIQACRDPRNDKFLEVAVHGRARLIVTGDRDLLDLHPFRGISILTPADFLQLD